MLTSGQEQELLRRLDILENDLRDQEGKMKQIIQILDILTNKLGVEEQCPTPKT
jgi:hypothetical protein